MNVHVIEISEEAHQVLGELLSVDCLDYSSAILGMFDLIELQTAKIAEYRKSKADGMHDLDIVEKARKESKNEKDFVSAYNHYFYEKYKNADQVICSTKTGETIGALYVNKICKHFEEKELKAFFEKVRFDLDDDE